MCISHREFVCCIGVIVALCVGQQAEADTTVAGSCGQADVQAAVDSATSGAIVSIPAGRCTWTGSVTVPNAKKLTLKGTGSSSTVITKSPAGTALFLGLSGSRVTAVGWVEAGIYVDGDDWRIDHCSFTAPSFQVGVFARGTRTTAHPRGVIDHNTFTNQRVVLFGFVTNYYGWSEPIRPGSPDMVFVEDNTFTFTVFGNVMDANYAGRYVFRYNVVVDGSIEAHSVQGGHRATRMWEVYNNTIRQVTQSMWTPFFLRGGTGVIFNNTITGSWSSPAITIDNVRTAESRPPAGKCDGTSTWDGNLEPNGYPCRDQIGRSTDAFLWTSSTSRPFPSQALDPAYAWNNWHGANKVFFRIQNNGQIHIKEGRDFFNETERPRYVPYMYPHPLTLTIASPTKLRITR